MAGNSAAPPGRVISPSRSSVTCPTATKSGALTPGSARGGSLEHLYELGQDVLARLFGGGGVPPDRGALTTCPRRRSSWGFPGWYPGGRSPLRRADAVAP